MVSFLWSDLVIQCILTFLFKLNSGIMECLHDFVRRDGTLSTCFSFFVQGTVSQSSI